MNTLSLEELLEKLRLGDESVEIEAKPGTKVSTDVLRTVSSFSNEPGRGGGYILLGLVEETDGLFGVNYRVAGVADPGKIQADLATRCANDLAPAVRPVITVEQAEGMAVLVVWVPEAPAGEKPIHIKAEGLPRGAYRRIASTDHHCTDDDLAVLYQGRATTAYDASPVEGTTAEDVDPAALAEYRSQRAKLKPDAGELRFNDDDLLYALGATTTKGGTRCLTIAGLMLFGKEASLRRLFPMARLDYVRVEGREWVPDPEKRYSTVEMRGPLMLLIPRVISQVLSDIPMAFSLSGSAIHRRDVPLIPRTVVREAVVNALMHRTYRIGSPVQIIRYSNRIEMRNPGASLVAEDRLGEPGSFPRNEKIAAALHEVGLAETKGTGISAMRAAMHGANLTPPLFESDRQRDEFRVMLLVHHLLGPDDVAWLAQFKEIGLSDEDARALVVLRESGAINNAMYRNINSVDTLTASSSLRRLREAGLLEARGKGRSTYYVPTAALLGPEGNSLSPGLNPGGNVLSPGLPPMSPGSEEAVVRGAHPPGVPTLPADLAAAVLGLGERAGPTAIRAVIVRLCAWHPLRPVDLGAILGRNPEYLQKQYLAPMRREGVLAFTKSDPADPQQAYAAVQSHGEQV